MLRFERIALFLVGAQMIHAQAPLPNSQLVDPPGQTVLYKFQTLPNSVQIYTCKPAAGGAFSWSAPDPDAVAVNDDQTLAVHHYKGPTWESTDGSLVHGTKAKHFQASREKSVDWLELTATDGSGKFAKVAFIHRIETSGGVAPASTGCDAAHAGDQVRVPYKATYVFYGVK